MPSGHSDWQLESDPEAQLPSWQWKDSYDLSELELCLLAVLGCGRTAGTGSEGVFAWSWLQFGWAQPAQGPRCRVWVTVLLDSDEQDSHCDCLSVQVTQLLLLLKQQPEVQVSSCSRTIHWQIWANNNIWAWQILTNNRRGDIRAADSVQRLWWWIPGRLTSLPPSWCQEGIGKIRANNDK